MSTTAHGERVFLLNNVFFPTHARPDEPLPAQVAKLIEKDLELLGATAIEDKLQDGVSETIQKLQTGGINVWVLTGDKMETAINIGAACSLLLDDMMQHVVSVPDGTLAEEAHELVQVQLESKLAAIEKPENAGSTHALIIDGRALAVVLNKEMTQLMMSVGSKCVAVVCCRVSPLQKAEVTALVQREGYKTLAVGDGANDVGMIQVRDCVAAEEETEFWERARFGVTIQVLVIQLSFNFHSIFETSSRDERCGCHRRHSRCGAHNSYF